MTRLHGTTALITGASSGIGEATALALAAEGATVALLARRADRLTELADRIRGDDGAAHVYEADVTDPAATRSAIDRLADELGGIDVLVNNAGFLANAPALDADLDDWHRMVDVNVNGVLTTTHAALPHVVRAAAGSRGIADIVTISSIAGRRVPSPESNVYAATKHAVTAFSEALRQDLVPKRVRVGLVEPGVVRTEMTTSGREHSPDGRTGDPLHPEDIADAIVYMVTRPARQAVNEILIRPTEQVR